MAGKYPLTTRLGSDDLNDKGVQFDESVTAIGWMKEHGLDMADLSIGFNTDDMEVMPSPTSPSRWSAAPA